MLPTWSLQASDVYAQAHKFRSGRQEKSDPLPLTDLLSVTIFPQLSNFSALIFPPSITFAQTPMQIRYTLVVSVVLRETFAACHPTALSFFGIRIPIHPSLCDRTQLYTTRALLLYYALQVLYPGQAPGVGQYIQNVGVEINEKETNLTTPQGWAAQNVKRIIDHFNNDGWNSQGTENGKTFFPVPYEDTTGYTPKNPGTVAPEDLRFPLRWQPLTRNLGNGDYSTQMHVVPHIGLKVKPFSMSSEQFEN